MHTSFEDIREGSIGRIGPDGDVVWERPRTRHEAGYRRSLAITLLVGIGLGVPLAIALVFILT